jgi:hypothetical protein
MPKFEELCKVKLFDTRLNSTKNHILSGAVDLPSKILKGC